MNASIHSGLNFQQKYDAYCRNDPSYEGIFITAVITTGIFCRPTCKARVPNIENIIFYDNTEQAIQNGYRPCKLCKPMEKLDETPDYVDHVIEELQLNPYLRIKDSDLKDRGIEPSQIRRWFKKHHNITFHAYQRMLRINSAYHTIKRGDSITQSALESGYDSLSGFNHSFRAIFGDCASQSANKSIINVVRLTTPIGPMFACATTTGVCLLDYTDRKMLETEFTDLCQRLDAVILPGPNRHLEQLQVQISEYFAATRKIFTVSLHTPSTAFRQNVWYKLQDIPYGEVRSYKQQAITLGNPKAVRAVASANGFNRVNILIPCHRVIGSDGQLVGYGGGLYRKKWLLDFEQSNV